jgi:hypothetical protein
MRAGSACAPSWCARPPAGCPPPPRSARRRGRRRCRAAATPPPTGISSTMVAVGRDDDQQTPISPSDAGHDHRLRPEGPVGPPAQPAGQRAHHRRRDAEHPDLRDRPAQHAARHRCRRRHRSRSARRGRTSTAEIGEQARMPRQAAQRAPEVGQPAPQRAGGGRRAHPFRAPTGRRGSRTPHTRAR